MFALLWRHIFYEMGGLDLRAFGSEEITFQSWLINITAISSNQAELPPVEEIHYTCGRCRRPFGAMSIGRLTSFRPRCG